MLVCILRISSKVAVWVRDIFGPSHSQTSLGRTRLDSTHTAVWRQGLLSRLKIENLIDQNHLKPSSFILVGKLDTVTSVCIFQLQEDTHTFSSPKFPILQPHHMPVQVQILFRWPELKFLCLYFSFPMNHWKEIPKPFFFFSILIYCSLYHQSCVSYMFERRWVCKLLTYSTTQKCISCKSLLKTSLHPW